jgi:hypothetical protein
MLLGIECLVGCRMNLGKSSQLFNWEWCIFFIPLWIK